jgi:heat shock protein HslJ
MKGSRPDIKAMLALVLAGAVSLVLIGSVGGSAQSIVPLEGTTWRLSDLSVGRSLAPVSVDDIATLRLSEGEATGTTACNAFFGRYIINGSAIRFLPIGGTRLACPPPWGPIESAYLGMFAQVASYSIDNGALSLADATGTVLARYLPELSTALVGGWSVDAFATADAGLSQPASGTELTLLLHDDGTVSGTSACNRFGGAYSARLDGSVLFGPISATAQACSDDLQTDEAALFSALEASVSWTVAKDALAFRNDAGVLTVLLKRLDQLAFLGPWVATGVADTQGALSPVTTPPPTIVFRGDGTLTGSTGCNDLFASYTVGLGTLAIGPVGTTRAACATDPQTTQEADYLAALEAATTWALQNGTLLLADAAGTTVATFGRPGEAPSPSGPAATPTEVAATPTEAAPTPTKAAPTPTEAPVTPSPEPTTKPTPKPSAKPTPKPTAKPSPKPTPKPTAKPTPKPTAKPTPKPTAKPTPTPSKTPTPKPTPTLEPTEAPTVAPTPTAAETVSPSESPAPSPTNPLPGTSWVLSEVNGTAVAPDATFQITASFTDTEMSGNAACNDYSGRYEISDTDAFALQGQIDVGAGSCDDDANAAESQYLTSLVQVTHWAVDDPGAPTKLTLRDDDDTTSLVYVIVPLESPSPPVSQSP